MLYPLSLSFFPLFVVLFNQPIFIAILAQDSIRPRLSLPSHLLSSPAWAPMAHRWGNDRRDRGDDRRNKDRLMEVALTTPPIWWALPQQSVMANWSMHVVVKCQNGTCQNFLRQPWFKQKSKWLPPKDSVSGSVQDPGSCKPGPSQRVSARKGAQCWI